MSDSPVEVTADTVPFAMVPYWVLSCSGNAVKLYAILLRFADNNSRSAWPSRATLAAEFGFKQVRSIDALITELEEAGAIDVIRSKTQLGTNANNRYHVNAAPRRKRTKPVVQTDAPPAEGVVQSDAKSSAVERTKVVHSNAPELRTMNYNQELEPKAPALFEPPVARTIVKANVSRDIAQDVHEKTKGAISFKASYSIIDWAVKAGYDPSLVHRSIGVLWSNGKPLTKALLGQTLEGIVTPGAPPARSTTNDRVVQALSLKEKYAAQEVAGR